MEGSSTSFRFDILAQLDNILTKITLYELLRLSKSTREALREVLDDSEAFIAYILAGCKKEDEEYCPQTSKCFPCITFTYEDMQIKGKHDRPMYYKGYIGSSEVSLIQVDPGTALSIMPHRVMQHLGIPSTDWVSLKLPYMDSMPMIRSQWERSNLGVRLRTWDPRWYAMSLTPTPHIICCWDNHKFIVTPSSHLLFIRPWNTLMKMAK